MRTIDEIYSSYRIHRGLQQHQLRVAAVAQMICEAITPPVDTTSVVLACLLHDMANIIKSDFAKLPHMFDPEGVEYWKQVQTEFIEKYGSDVEAATSVIAREMGVPENVIACFEGSGFSEIDHIRDSASVERKIMKYADMRVAPNGVVELQERIDEAHSRYWNVASKHNPDGEERYQELVAAAHDLERQIFAHTSLKPEDITEEAVQPIVERLRATLVV